MRRLVCPVRSNTPAARRGPVRAESCSHSLSTGEPHYIAPSSELMPPMRIERPQQVLEEDKLGKKIAHVQFGMFGNEEVERLAEFEVTSDRGYEQPGRTPVSNGVLDRRLGISDKHNSCETCGMRMQDCPGHFGYIRLELPVLHIGYLKQTVAVLQCICKTCSRILLPPKERLKFRKAFMHPITMVDTVRRSGVFKKVCAYACSMCMCICMKQGRRAAR